jgi:predicted protein tyrosine phosphatase
MDLKVLGCVGAVYFVPDRPTYAIRLYSSKAGDWQKTSLQGSAFYLRVAEYVFDDNEMYPFRMENGPVWITDDIASRIIDDFSEHVSAVDCLLVHCIRGKNRSPAVAMALNEVFKLGHDDEELKKRYPEFNRYAYGKIIEAAKKRKL